MKKSELKKLFLNKKAEIFEKYDTPGEALGAMGEDLPVIIFKGMRLHGYAGPGENTFCEEGTFFSGDGLSELGQVILDKGLPEGLEAAADETEAGCVKALISLADRYYKKAELLALKHDTDWEKDMLYQSAEVMRHLSNRAPGDFGERMQLLWLMEMGEILMDSGKVMSTALVEMLINTSEEMGHPIVRGDRRVVDDFFRLWKFSFFK